MNDNWQPLKLEAGDGTAIEFRDLPGMQRWSLAYFLLKATWSVLVYGGTKMIFRLPDDAKQLPVAVVGVKEGDET